MISHAPDPPPSHISEPTADSISKHASDPSASHRLSHVEIRGIASAVPARIERNNERFRDFGESEVLRISQQIGISERRIAHQLCTSDLCFHAAQALLTALSWTTDSVDVLLFVSQTPDYRLPATACSLHGRLGLAKRCVALDINLGCSGYVYGLWMAAQFLSQTPIRRILLLVGDTPSRFVSPHDITTALLFGDAGTATALEFSLDANPMFFCMGTDGSGQSHLIIPAGGYRHPSQEQTRTMIQEAPNRARSAEDLWMDGAEVFAFTLREIPKLLQQTLASAQWTVEQIDAFVPHQANQWMLQQLIKRIHLPPHKLVSHLQQFGNTSSASIPLAMTTELATSLQQTSMRLLLAGFGVGWSWAALAWKSSHIVVVPLLQVEESTCNTPWI